VGTKSLIVRNAQGITHVVVKEDGSEQLHGDFTHRKVLKHGVEQRTIRSTQANFRGVVDRNNFHLNNFNRNNFNLCNSHPNRGRTNYPSFPSYPSAPP
jgi:hypothetical protein